MVTIDVFKQTDYCSIKLVPVSLLVPTMSFYTEKSFYFPTSSSLYPKDNQFQYCSFWNSYDSTKLSKTAYKSSSWLLEKQTNLIEQKFKIVQQRNVRWSCRNLLNSGVTQTCSSNNFSDNISSNSAEARPTSRERRRERRLIGQRTTGQTAASDWSSSSIMSNAELAVPTSPNNQLQRPGHRRARNPGPGSDIQLSGSSLPSSTFLNDLEIKTSQIGLMQRKDGSNNHYPNDNIREGSAHSSLTETQDGLDNSSSMGSLLLTANRVTPPPKPGVPPQGYSPNSVGPLPYQTNQGISAKTNGSAGTSTNKKYRNAPSKTNTDKFMYSDPSSGANTSFLHRLNELNCLENETIRYEKLRGAGAKVKKK